MKTTKLLLTLLLLLPLNLLGQEATPAINTSDYNFAVGLRGGNTSGLTLKKNNGAYSLEGIVGLWSHGLHGTFLYERNVSAGVRGLNWYYGGGGHLSAYTGEIYHGHYKHWNHRHDHFYNDGLGLGVDGIVGIEYKIPPIPFAISLDLKPFVEVTTRGNVWGALDAGLGIKFTF